MMGRGAVPMSFLQAVLSAVDGAQILKAGKPASSFFFRTNGAVGSKDAALAAKSAPKLPSNLHPMENPSSIGSCARAAILLNAPDYAFIRH